MSGVSNKELTTPKEVIDILVNSCLQNNINSFFPYYLLSKVKVSMPWKRDFWNWFEKMYSSGRQRSDGAWKLRLEPYFYNTKATSYCFYDETHTHPRFTVDITETENENEIYLEIMPF